MLSTRNDLEVAFQLSFIPIINTVLVLIQLGYEVIYLFNDVSNWTYFNWLIQSEPVSKVTPVISEEDILEDSIPTRPKKTKKKTQITIEDLK